MNVIEIDEKIEEIQQLEHVVLNIEKFYDNLGLSLSFVVLKNNTLVMSSKHWLYNYYIHISNPFNNINKQHKKFTLIDELWEILIQLSRKINRGFQVGENDKYMIYLSKLNRTQTSHIYEMIITELNNRNLNFLITKSFDILGWKNDNATKIPWIM